MALIAAFLWWALVALGIAIQAQYSMAPPSADVHSRLISSAAVLVLWAVAMSVLGAGTARNLKRYFQPERAFRILFGVALAGLVTSSALRLIIAWITSL